MNVALNSRAYEPDVTVFLACLTMVTDERDRWSCKNPSQGICGMRGGLIENLLVPLFTKSFTVSIKTTNSFSLRCDTLQLSTFANSTTKQLPLILTDLSLQSFHLACSSQSTPFLFIVSKWLTYVVSHHINNLMPL
jgi:hypothetical protein